MLLLVDPSRDSSFQMGTGAKLGNPAKYKPELKSLSRMLSAQQRDACGMVLQVHN
jgi:hypothetical protein